MKSLVYSLAAAVAFLALPLQATAGSRSAPPDTAVASASGRTTVEFDSDFLTSLDALDVTVHALARLSRCSVKNDSVTLPIAGGIYDPVSSTGEIQHGGGLVLRTDTVEVVLSNLTLDFNPGSTPVITGLVVVDGSLQGR